MYFKIMFTVFRNEGSIMFFLEVQSKSYFQIKNNKIDKAIISQGHLEGTYEKHSSFAKMKHKF